MNDSIQDPENDMANASPEEIAAALFANMVIQQTNMAMMLLGKVPHPETGKFLKDIEAAKMFIDQLEMLETKTKGNLNKQEEGLIKQALTALHMTFVEAMDAPADSSEEVPSAPSPSSAKAAPPAEAAPENKPASTSQSEALPAHDESRKKFSKKY